MISSKMKKRMNHFKQALALPRKNSLALRAERNADGMKAGLNSSPDPLEMDFASWFDDFVTSIFQQLDS